MTIMTSLLHSNGNLDWTTAFTVYIPLWTDQAGTIVSPTGDTVPLKGKSVSLECCFTCMDRAYVRMTHRLNRSNVSLSVPKDPSAFFGEHGRTFPCFTHSILLRWDRRWWWRKKTPLRQALHHRRGCWPTPWLSIQIEDCPRTHDPPSDPDSESADEKGQNDKINENTSYVFILTLSSPDFPKWQMP